MGADSNYYAFRLLDRCQKKVYHLPNHYFWWNPSHVKCFQEKLVKIVTKKANLTIDYIYNMGMKLTWFLKCYQVIYSLKITTHQRVIKLWNRVIKTIYSTVQIIFFFFPVVFILTKLISRKGRIFIFSNDIKIVTYHFYH